MINLVFSLMNLWLTSDPAVREIIAYSLTGFVCLMVCWSVTLKSKFVELQCVFIGAGEIWGMDGGCVPLPTHPQKYCTVSRTIWGYFIYWKNQLGFYPTLVFFYQIVSSQWLLKLWSNAHMAHGIEDIKRLICLKDHQIVALMEMNH